METITKRGPGRPPKAQTEDVAAARPAFERTSHLEGCPEDPERMESYPGSTPRNRPAVIVTRCQDCGAHETKEA